MNLLSYVMCFIEVYTLCFYDPFFMSVDLLLFSLPDKNSKSKEHIFFSEINLFSMWVHEA